MSSDNIVELSSARAASSQDQRLHPRIESDDRLFTQVVLSAENPDLIGTTLSCTAVNLSVGAIQFRTSAPVPTGSLFLGCRPSDWVPNTLFASPVIGLHSTRGTCL